MSIAKQFCERIESCAIYSCYCFFHEATNKLIQIKRELWQENSVGPVVLLLFQHHQNLTSERKVLICFITRPSIEHFAGYSNLANFVQLRNKP